MHGTVPTDYSRIIADRLESDGLLLRHEIREPSHKFEFKTLRVAKIVTPQIISKKDRTISDIYVQYHAIWKFMLFLNNSRHKCNFASHVSFLDEQQLMAIANIPINIPSLNKRTARIMNLCEGGSRHSHRPRYVSDPEEVISSWIVISTKRVRGTDQKKNSVGKKWVDKLQRILLNSSQRVANTLRIRS